MASTLLPPTLRGRNSFLGPPDRVARRLLGKLLILQSEDPSDDPTMTRRGNFPGTSPLFHA